MGCDREHLLSVCGIYLKNAVISTDVLSPPGGQSQRLREGSGSLQWVPDLNCRAQWPVPMYLTLHLLLSNKTKLECETEPEVPKCLRTFHQNVAGLMGSCHGQKCQESSLLRFQALCCKFSGPDGDQMSQVQITIQTFRWGLKPNLCSQTIPNVLITSFSLLSNPIQERIVISLIADAYFAHQWKI